MPMGTSNRKKQDLLEELQEAREQLREAEETLRAIRSGEVDALVVSTAEGENIFTLKGADEVYRIFVETMSEGAVTLADNGIILYCNERFAEIVGTSFEKAVGLSIYDFVMPDDRQAMNSLVQNGLKGRAKKELYLRSHNGLALPVFLSIRPFHRPDAEVALCMVVTDLSELKSREELAQKLEAANREMEAFSYSISHDLREPLRAIEGFSRMLLTDLQDKLDDETKRKFGVIREKSKKMNQLIEAVLTFSRLGRQALAAVPVDSERLVRDVWSELQEGQHHRHLVLKVSPLAPCPGDPNMLRQVYANLLSNAVKFTKERDTAIIEVGSEEKTDECIYYVKDNGVGFDMRFADKLFKLFQRLHNEEEFAGTGVGLSFVKRIIERHGGRVWAEGKLQESATFYFTLPKK